jgi:hypothetical protein
MRKSFLFPAFLGLLLIPAALRAEPVSRETRALVAVVGLAEHASKNRMLYRMEDRTALRVTEKARGAYATMTVLAHEEASFKNFIEAIEKAQADPAIQAIDVVFYIHGHVGELCFNGQEACLPTAELAKHLKPEKLRAVYSDACHGSTHLTDLLNAGFQVAAGSASTDANKALDYRRFLKNWLRGFTFEKSIDEANHLWLSRVMDKIISGNSTKITQGQGNLTISESI